MTDYKVPRFTAMNTGVDARRVNNNKKRYKRKFNRELLPSPAAYYAQQFPKMNIRSEWVSVNCCFHSPDNKPSLSLSMISGKYCCFSCGANGRGIMDFHKQRYNMTFFEAMIALDAWEGNHD